MSFMNVADEDLKEFLSAEDYEYATTYRIPQNGDFSRLYNLQARVSEGVASGALKTIPYEPVIPQRAPGVISDDLGFGCAGMFSHADGKQYDSKSAYERSVKARGLEIVGNEKMTAQKRESEPQGIRQDIHNALNRHGA